MRVLNVSPEVAEKLKYYVYLYLDPETGRVFYVGKGKGNRVLSHLYEMSKSEKVQKIRDLQSRGLEPKIEILVHGLENEMDALRIEAAVIDLLGKDNVTNQVRGWGNQLVGRSSLEELQALYNASPVLIDDAALLIRINRLYRYGMSPQELYEATRGVWLIGERRKKVRVAFATFQGIVREVYHVDDWFPAGSTDYLTRPAEEVSIGGRWKFVGRVAETTLREKYLDKSIRAYFSDSSQNPLRYVNC